MYHPVPKSLRNQSHINPLTLWRYFLKFVSTGWKQIQTTAQCLFLHHLGNRIVFNLHTYIQQLSACKRERMVVRPWHCHDTDHSLSCFDYLSEEFWLTPSNEQITGRPEFAADRLFQYAIYRWNKRLPKWRSCRLVWRTNNIRILVKRYIVELSKSLLSPEPINIV